MAGGSLTDFVFEGQPVRLVRNGELWFVLADVCQALELGNTTKTAERLDNDEKGFTSIQSLGGPQEMLIVSEPGLYKLVATSRKPVAQRFDRLVRHEVLPSIRKYGCYPPPNNVIPQEMTALTEMFDQFGRKFDRKLDEKLAPLHDDIHQINSKLQVVVDNSNKGRKYATVETERTHHKVVCHHYFMLCPCEKQCGIKIADENGFTKDAWHHHHQFGPWDNSPEAMIPLAIECHNRITRDRNARRLFDQTAFPQFQDLLARMPVKQLTLDLKL
jgi:prophage antirepressor-like protein